MIFLSRLRGVAWLSLMACGLLWAPLPGGGEALAQTAKKSATAKAAVAEKAKDGQAFGDWTAKCGQGGCVLVQSQNVEGGARLIQFTIGKVGTQGESGAVAMIPLGIHLPAGALLVLDGKTIPLVLKTCSQQGCQATVQLTNAQMGEIGKAQALEIALMDDNTRQSLMIALSTKGLGQGLAAIR